MILLGFLLLPVFLLTAFLFAAGEVAFFQVAKLDVSRWRNRDESANKRIAYLLDQPRRLLLLTVTGLAFSVFLFAADAALLVHTLTPDGSLRWGVYFALIAVAMPILILLGVVLPRIYAIAHPIGVARFTSRFLMAARWILFPIITPFVIASKAISRMLRVDRERLSMSDRQLDALLEEEETSAPIDESERQIIKAVLDFRETTAKDIMVPRIDLVALPVDTSIPKAIATFRESMHSRIPVYEGTIDKIIGVLYAKDLLGELPPGVTVRKLVHATYFVPENKLVNLLLKEFQRLRLHLAIVVDEYGGVAGVVTLEDILEEIIGEIRDEYDDQEPVPLVSVRTDEWLATGRLPVFDLNELMKEQVVVPAEEYDTLGGFLNYLAGKLPEQGDTFERDAWLFTVEKRSGNRILTVRFKRNTNEDNGSDTIS